MKLTEDQQYIHDDIIKNITQVIPKYKNYPKDKRMFSIEGSAGMGKSVLTAFLAKSLSQDYKMRVSTPTHKSLNVLSEMLDNHKISSDVDISTIHSYLKLTPKEDYDNGKLVLEVTGQKIEQVDVLFIDEGSMVGESLYKFVDSAIIKGYIKCVIWISDKHQLDPVLDNINPIYSMNIKKYTLTKIIRQAEGNPIIELATKIRKCIEHKIYPSNDAILETLKNSACSNIELYKSDKDFMSRYFNSEFDIYGNLLVSYTNNYINHLNKQIRNIHIPNSENYVLGEYLLFNSSYSKDDIVLFNNNETIQIKNLQKSFSSEYNIDYWIITDSEDKEFKAVDPDDWVHFDSELKKLSNAAINTTDKLSKRNLWRMYFELKNEFQKVSYTYACTIHKSQGSSVNEIFINLRDLFRCRSYLNNVDFLKLLYVAITRTKYNLIFLV